jgi:hypothetical protein
VPQDKRFYLDLGNVHEIARVRLNGTDLPMRPWPPYLWDVTASIKEGVNALEVQVQTVPAQSRGSFGGGAPGAAGGRRGGPGAPGPEAGAARGPAPTGVPSGAANRGGLYSAPPPVAASGLLGPVRLLAQ